MGINIERPDHATLAVGGNVLVSGTLNHYSDQRVKENITIADCQEELQKVKQLNLYNYSYTDEFCDYSNIDQSAQFGVLAQEVRTVTKDWRWHFYSDKNVEKTMFYDGELIKLQNHLYLDLNG